jgi:hypothetical protein
MTPKIRQAFEAVCDGYSPDRVVADPLMNEAFLQECHQLGLEGSPATLNRAILNLRKKGGLRGLKSKKLLLPNRDQYEFAAEMAARFIERRDGVSLDDIICDPVIAQEFDQVYARIAPGYSPLEYRWAALGLRKAKRLKPELLSRVVTADNVQVQQVADIEISNIATKQGMYVFFTSARALYVGEAENLQNRIRKHLDHSDNKGLARWLWEQGSEALHLEIHVLPDDTPTRMRRALEMELILSRDPLFNIKR